MKKHFLATVFLLLSAALAFGQNQNTSAVQCGPIASGATCTFINGQGAGTINLEYKFSGSPATVSVVVQGCMTGGTCDTLDTYTGTSDTNRHIDIGTKGPYPKYTITPTFTGGTSPKVTVNAYGTIARVGGGISNFGQMTSGTNTTATMTVGTGATMTTSGSGVINANEFLGALGNCPVWAAGYQLSYNSGTSQLVCGQTGNPASLSAGANVDLATVASGSNVVRSTGTYLDTITTASLTAGWTIYVTYPSAVNSITPTSGTIAGSASLSSIVANTMVKIVFDGTNYEVSAVGGGGTSTSIYGVHTTSDIVGGSGSGPYAFPTTDTSIGANKLNANNSYIHVTAYGVANNTSGANAFYSYRVVLNDGTNTVTQTMSSTQTVANNATNIPWKVVAEVNCKTGGTVNIMNLDVMENASSATISILPSPGTQNFTLDCTKALTISVAEIGTLAANATTTMLGLNVEAHP